MKKLFVCILMFLLLTACTNNQIVDDQVENNDNSQTTNNEEKEESTKDESIKENATLDESTNTIPKIKNNIDAVSHATCSMAMDTSAKGIVISSISGKTVRFVSRFRCPVTIIGLTVDEKAYRKLSLNWGVVPIKCEEYDSVDKMLSHASKVASEVLELKKNDTVILTGGEIGRKDGSTNTIRLEVIE